MSDIIVFSLMNRKHADAQNRILKAFRVDINPLDSAHFKQVKRIGPTLYFDQE